MVEMLASCASTHSSPALTMEQENRGNGDVFKMSLSGSERVSFPERAVGGDGGVDEELFASGIATMPAPAIWVGVADITTLGVIPY